MTGLNSKKLKKGVTPIIAVIMLLLITLSLAGMAMMIFTQLGKSSQAQIEAAMKEYNIKGEISNAKATPNQNNFEFNIKNYANKRLPLDGINTEIILNANGIPVKCTFNPDEKDDSKCDCTLLYENNKEDAGNDWKFGLQPGTDYLANCTYESETFSIVKNYVVEWYYLGEGGRRLISSDTVNVGAVN